MIEQDIEGSLEIAATQMDSYNSAGSVTGICQDFFELRMVSIYHMKTSTECICMMYIAMYTLFIHAEQSSSLASILFIHDTFDNPSCAMLKYSKYMHC